MFLLLTERKTIITDCERPHQNRFLILCKFWDPSWIQADFHWFKNQSILAALQFYWWPGHSLPYNFGISRDWSATDHRSVPINAVAPDVTPLNVFLSPHVSSSKGRYKSHHGDNYFSSLFEEWIVSTTPSLSRYPSIVNGRVQPVRTTLEILLGS